MAWQGQSAEKPNLASKDLHVLSLLREHAWGLLDWTGMLLQQARCYLLAAHTEV